jgi:uncharacterized DUF497 family protein
VKITFDPAKRQAVLNQRGLNFADVVVVFAGPTITLEDVRRDYGETRFQGRLPRGSNGDGRLDAA